MPGPGTIYIAQESKFIKPVFINDTITAICEIVSIDVKNKAEINTIVVNQNDETVIIGKALELLPSE